MDNRSLLSEIIVTKDMKFKVLRTYIHKAKLMKTGDNYFNDPRDQ